MSKLAWDLAGTRKFETGVSKGVLYPLNAAGAYTPGVAWNGLTGVTESPSGAEPSDFYADDIKYASMRSAEEFGATIEAYTYPDEFAICDGSAEVATGVVIGQQERKTFGFCYRTVVGDDGDNNRGYKLHLIYGCTASPSERGYQTINDSPDAIQFSWELNTTPVNVTGHKPTACITIDSTKANAAKLAALEDILYGTAMADPRLPLPDEIASLMGSSAAYAVVNYLANVASSNTDNVAGATYESVLTAVSGYTIKNVVVTMGGVDITDTAYDSETGEIDIVSVTGPIVIYATANET